MGRQLWQRVTTSPEPELPFLVLSELPPLALPQLDQSLFYRNTIREFNRGPHDPYN